MNQKQITAYYLKNMLNSDLGLMTDDMTFVRNMARYSMGIFDFDITPLMNTLPDDTTDDVKIALYRDILNGKIDLLDDSNLLQKTKAQISDAIPQMHTVDITAYDFDKNLSLIADAFDLPSESRPLLQLFISIFSCISLSSSSLLTFEDVGRYAQPNSRGWNGIRYIVVEKM